MIRCATGGAYTAIRIAAVPRSISERILDLFKVRAARSRSAATLRSGRLYFRNEMCLAPCFAGCTKEEYTWKYSGS